MNVQDIMTEDPITLEASATIAQAIDLLGSLDIRHLPIVRDNELVGMISDRDMRDFEIPAMLSASGAPDTGAARNHDSVAALMQTDVLTVGGETDVSEVVRIMIDQKVGAIPVVDEMDGRLVGIVSYIDLLRAAEDFFAGN